MLKAFEKWELKMIMEDAFQGTGANPSLTKRLVNQLMEATSIIEDLQSGLSVHVVELTDDAFAIQHPLECRPNLLDCKVWLAFGELESRPELDNGFYRCELDESGRIIITERVDQ